MNISSSNLQFIGLHSKLCIRIIKLLQSTKLLFGNTAATVLKYPDRSAMITKCLMVRNKFNFTLLLLQTYTANLHEKSDNNLSAFANQVYTDRRQLQRVIKPITHDQLISILGASLRTAKYIRGGGKNPTTNFTWFLFYSVNLRCCST